MALHGPRHAKGPVLLMQASSSSKLRLHMCLTLREPRWEEHCSCHSLDLLATACQCQQAWVSCGGV
jgi:hypothetical protein